LAPTLDWWTELGYDFVCRVSGHVGFAMPWGARTIPPPLRCAGLPPSLRFGATSRTSRSAAKPPVTAIGRGTTAGYTDQSGAEDAALQALARVRVPGMVGAHSVRERDSAAPPVFARLRRGKPLCWAAVQAPRRPHRPARIGIFHNQGARTQSFKGFQRETPPVAPGQQRWLA